MSSAGNNDRLSDHNYDGIQEYDNPLPGWWTWLFIASIVFSVFYVGYYQIGTGPTVQKAYLAEMVAHIEAQLAGLGNIRPDDATILEFKDKKDWMTAMSGVFRGNCAQCHAADGGGNVGPNLTDDSYKNIKGPSDFFKVISGGVPGTAMAPWKDRFREPQIILLAAYVASLRGTTPAAPKAPEGTAIAPWPAPGTAPSAAAPTAPPAPPKSP